MWTIATILAVLSWPADGRVDNITVAMDFNGDGAVDLLDVMTAQICGMDPHADWEPIRTQVRTVQIRTRTHWDCRAIVSVGGVSVEWAQGIEATVYVGSERVPLFTQHSPDEVIWIDVPDGVALEIDVRTATKTIVVGSGCVGVRE
jgi:hypothetical protein